MNMGSYGRQRGITTPHTVRQVSQVDVTSVLRVETLMSRVFLSERKKKGLLPMSTDKHLGNNKSNYKSSKT